MCIFLPHNLDSHETNDSQYRTGRPFALRTVRRWSLEPPLTPISIQKVDAAVHNPGRLLAETSNNALAMLTGFSNAIHEIRYPCILHPSSGKPGFSLELFQVGALMPLKNPIFQKTFSNDSDLGLGRLHLHFYP